MGVVKRQSDVRGASALCSDKASLAGAWILFLDGDNVLLRRPHGDSLEGLPALESALRRPALAHVRIVASGQWKDVMSFEGIRNLFSEDLRPRMIGTTPDIRNPRGFKPHVEIFAWLAAHPEIRGYGVLEPHWPTYEPCPDCAVFIRDGTVFGEDPRDVGWLEELFATV